jgi:hypothetical protein
MLAVGVPLVMRRPEPRHHEDRKFTQRRRALEADIVAEMTYAVGELGARNRAWNGPRRLPRGPPAIACATRC